MVMFLGEFEDSIKVTPFNISSGPNRQLVLSLKPMKIGLSSCYHHHKPKVLSPIRLVRVGKDTQPHLIKVVLHKWSMSRTCVYSQCGGMCL